MLIISRSEFTFHNVSINSLCRDNRMMIGNFHLHSIMYLLILAFSICQKRPPATFTFHNVSINSGFYNHRQFYHLVFTFHNVSINSVWISIPLRCLINLHSIMYLLIHMSSIKLDVKPSLIYIP